MVKGSRKKVKNRLSEPKVKELKLAENLELEVWWEEPRNPRFGLALRLTGYVSLDKSSSFSLSLSFFFCKCRCSE